MIARVVTCIGLARGDTRRRAIWLWCELLGVFVAVPLLMYEGVLPNWPIPFLLLGMIWALLVLRRDASFDRQLLVRREGLGAGFRSRLVVDLPLLLLLGLAVCLGQPGMLFSLVKTSPKLWLVVIIFYPLLSVYPQELLYRTYFFHRFKLLFGDGAGVIAASAALFGFVHIVFGNWISIALTVIGGVLFGVTYRKTRSLLVTCLEHALFGGFIFTIGIGRFFYLLRR